MLTTQDIRERFTQFFIDKGHEKIESSPLIPQNDPTLLFANAGMNQFKDNFTGKANPKNRRAVTIQKCVRAGGKHNDLENVGFTARHHTFFEMLGNFSFGDYFKKEAIAYAWEFLTVEMKIPKDKLYVTVHDSDEEARIIWHEQEGVPLDRIFYMGDKDNFWEMGELGPCGPCSEIFYDHGAENSDGADTTSCLLNDEGRYVEIWNLVFMQFEKYKDKNGEIKRKELPRPSVDTGAGLERLVACMQNVYWNYDGDGFNALKNKIEKISGKKYSDPKAQTSMRVICDHIRSATMLITDGVMPSNEGRGYVLRRIIRRAVRHLNELGLEKPSIHQLVPTVFESLGTEYPQNQANADLAIKLLKLEEEKFRQTLKTGLDLLYKEIKNLKGGNSLSGEIAFKLYDTYGFPLDLTEIIAQEKGLSLNTVEFDKAMAKQKASSKSASKFAAQDDNSAAFYKIKESTGESKFTGYSNLIGESNLIANIPFGQYQALVFKETPFYPEGGGQVGDTGLILNDKNEILAEVLDTQRPVEGLIAHICDVQDELIKDTKYILKVDKLKRNLTTRNHSATHLLQSALIKVLGNHVKQAGSRVDSDSLRFDFTHPEALTKKQIKQVENLVNQSISENLLVQATLMTKDEATEKGAMALFGEKYGDTVRVVEMDQFSLELCGGTHVEKTNDIGLFAITLETSLSSGVRRIEATSSITAFSYLQERSQVLNRIERIFSAKDELLLSKLEASQLELKAKSKEIQKLKDQLQAQSTKDLFNKINKFSNGVGLVSIDLKDGLAKDFRSISDKFVSTNKEDILLIYQVDGDKISYLLRTDKGNSKINCSKILKAAQELINGRGGGRADMVQGSGDATKANEFLTEIENQVKGL